MLAPEQHTATKKYIKDFEQDKDLVAFIVTGMHLSKHGYSVRDINSDKIPIYKK